jgi:hypothetical protein
VSALVLQALQRRAARAGGGCCASAIGAALSVRMRCVASLRSREKMAEEAGGNEMESVKNYFNTAGFERWNKIYGTTSARRPRMRCDARTPLLRCCALRAAAPAARAAQGVCLGGARMRFSRLSGWLRRAQEVNKVQMDIRTGHAQTVDKVIDWLQGDGQLEGTSVCDVRAHALRAARVPAAARERPRAHAHAPPGTPASRCCRRCAVAPRARHLPQCAPQCCLALTPELRSSRRRAAARAAWQSRWRSRAPPSAPATSPRCVLLRIGLMLTTAASDSASAHLSQSMASEAQRRYEAEVAGGATAPAQARSAAALSRLAPQRCVLTPALVCACFSRKRRRPAFTRLTWRACPASTTRSPAWTS